MIKLTKSYATAIAFMLLGCISTKATTVNTSAQSGNWGSSSTWTTSGSGNPVLYIIQVTHTVILTSSTASRVDSVFVHGTLEFNNNKDLTLQNNGAILVYTAGAVTNGNNNSNIIFSGAGGASTIDGSYNVTGPVYANKNTFGFVANAALPVVLLDFKATVAVDNTRSIVLKWETAHEENSSRFDVQRSTDGKRWTTIGSVKAKGNSSEVSAYQFVDNNPTGGMNYYRFIQVDLNNQSSYSPVTFAAIAAEGSEITINTYPNPANTELNIAVANQDGDEELNITIINSLGQTIEVPITKTLGFINIQTGKLAEGLYRISIKSATVNFNQGVLITH